MSTTESQNVSVDKQITSWLGKHNFSGVFENLIIIGERHRAKPTGESVEKGLLIESPAAGQFTGKSLHKACYDTFRFN